MKILTRYVLREHLGPLTFALSALTALLLLNQVAKDFGQLVGKGLSWSVIGEVFYLSVPFIIAMTLPMAVLVAVLYAFSRLAAENEVTALRASGVSVVSLVRPVMWGGAVLALLMLLFNDQVLPRANHRLRTLETDIARKKPTFALREQVINEVIPGKIFLRAGHIDPGTNRMREVFIYNFEDPTQRKTIYADSGQMGLTEDQSTLQMTLHHGYVIQVPRDNPGTLQRLYFRNDLVRVRGVANRFEKTEKDSYKSEREMTVCEMDRQYQQGAYQLEVANSDLGTLLANATHYIATGEAAAPAKPIPQREHATMGALYCRLVSTVFGGVQSAQAAELPPRQLPDSGRTKPRPKQGGVAGTRHTPAQGGAAKGKHAPPRGGVSTAKHAPAKPGTSMAKRLPMLGGLAGRRLPQQPQRVGIDTARPSAANVPPQEPQPGRTVILSPQPGRALVNPAAVVPIPTAGQLDIITARMTDARTTMSRYEVEIQKKFALAVACIVFVLFGAPIALRFPRGGVGLVIGVSLVAFALYYVCLIAGETLADNLVLSPFWAMWMANAIFTAVGAVLLVRVQRSGATARGGDAREIWEAIKARVARRRAATAAAPTVSERAA